MLRNLGYDVLVGVEVLAGTADQEVLDRCRGEGRILLTNDKDFGELVFRRGLGCEGVLFLRLRDESAGNRVRMARVSLEKLGDRLKGRFVTVSERGIRTRKMPR